MPSHLGVNSRHPWSPRALTVVSARKLEKLALNSGTTGGARKMTQNASKTIIAATGEGRAPVSVASWNVHQIRDDLNLGHFHCHARSQGRSQPSMNCDDQGHLLLHTTGEQQLVQENSSCNCGNLDRLPRLRTNLLEPRNKDIEHLINVLQLGNHNGKQSKGICNCAMTGMSTTCLCSTTAISTTLSMN